MAAGPQIPPDGRLSTAAHDRDANGRDGGEGRSAEAAIRQTAGRRAAVRPAGDRHHDRQQRRTVRHTPSHTPVQWAAGGGGLGRGKPPNRFCGVHVGGEGRWGVRGERRMAAPASHHRLMQVVNASARSEGDDRQRDHGSRLVELSRRSVVSRGQITCQVVSLYGPSSIKINTENPSILNLPTVDSVVAAHPRRGKRWPPARGCPPRQGPRTTPELGNPESGATGNWPSDWLIDLD